ncbi:HAD family hydrolase [Roseinatronobacter alkalisoli]|uniref:HAD family phosphatase n=1 Tax=Roseinatronobacter alkalisoli TaxID=3028235 RepID=A0ABT5TAZ3_9RHOB|nr:HAD family phosphatase [Roseinatronobacter sp. HJB301]MDD7971103.1 HAD family phosphatase [Roseinatronobacter sp. HJB301]
MTRDIHAVVFDIGNVLIGWNPEQFYDSLIGQDRRKALFAAVDLDGMNARIDRGARFHDTVLGMIEFHPEWETEIMIWHDRWIDMIAPVIAPSVQMLRNLRAQSVPVYALSNFGDDTFTMAQNKYEFLHEFDRAFISGRLGVMKPETRIYEILEDETGVAPENLFFIDDRAENIEAAVTRGWAGHVFRSPGGLKDSLVQLGLPS